MSSHKQIIQSERHNQALYHALGVIKKSAIAPFVKELYLYGSCARKEEEWDSDVDLFMELKEDFRNHKELKMPLRLLISFWRRSLCQA